MMKISKRENKIEIQITWAHTLLAAAYFLITALNYYFGNRSIGIFPIELFFIFLPFAVGLSIFSFILILTTVRVFLEEYGYSSLQVMLISLKNNVSFVDKAVIFQIAFGILISIIFLCIVVVAHRKKVARISGIAVYVSLSLLWISGYSMERSDMTTTNIVSSASRWLYYDLAIENVKNAASITNQRSSLVDYSRTTNLTDTYIFIIESFGVFKDDEANKNLRKIFERIPASKFTFYNLMATGAGTVGGEFRELCGLKIRNSLVVDKFFDVGTCAPKKFSDRNFNTIAIHGGTYGMFNRPYYYPLMGFNTYISARDMTDIRSCGGGWLSAPCDIFIINKLDRYLPPSPRFVYFLTCLSGCHTQLLDVVGRDFVA